jgi:hypothetical protein
LAKAGRDMLMCNLDLSDARAMTTGAIQRHSLAIARGIEKPDAIQKDPLVKEAWEKEKAVEAGCNAMGVHHDCFEIVADSMKELLKRESMSFGSSLVSLCAAVGVDACEKKSEELKVKKFAALAGEEDDTSKQAIVASEQASGVIARLAKGGTTLAMFVKAFFENYWATIKDTAGCTQWEGAPYVSKCLEHAPDFMCADCAQKLNAACSVLGVVGGAGGVGAVFGAILTGGKYLGKGLWAAGGGATALGDKAVMAATEAIGGEEAVAKALARKAAVREGAAAAAAWTGEKLTALGRGAAAVAENVGLTRARKIARHIADPRWRKTLVAGKVVQAGGSAAAGKAAGGTLNVIVAVGTAAPKAVKAAFWDLPNKATEETMKALDGVVVSGVKTLKVNVAEKVPVSEKVKEITANAEDMKKEGQIADYKTRITDDGKTEVTLEKPQCVGEDGTVQTMDNIIFNITDGAFAY